MHIAGLRELGIRGFARKLYWRWSDNAITESRDARDQFAPLLEMKQKLPRLREAGKKEPRGAGRSPRATTGLPRRSPAAGRRR